MSDPSSPTMEALTFWSELEGRRVTLYSTGDGALRFRPLSALSEEEIETLKKYKGELLALLDSPEEFTPATPATQESISDTYGDSAGGRIGGSMGGTLPQSLPPRVKAELGRVSELGLVARWSREFGFISLHDPTTGEWHDLPTQHAPAWARNEAHRRKEIYKSGGDSMMPARALEALWAKEQLQREFRSTAVNDKGVLYEDYIEDYVEED